MVVKQRWHLMRRGASWQGNRMSEFHIIDSSTNGATIHARQFDDETSWTVEVSGNQPKLSKQLLSTGATQRTGYSSLVVDASTEQLIMFLAAATGYRCKLAKKQKRQYSEETKARMAERLRNLHPMRNAFHKDISAQD